MQKVKGKVVVCPENPQHTKIWKKGLDATRYGPRQRYICFTCGCSFYASQEIEKWPPKRKKRVKKEVSDD